MRGRRTVFACGGSYQANGLLTELLFVLTNDAELKVFLYYYYFYTILYPEVYLTITSNYLTLLPFVYFYYSFTNVLKLANSILGVWTNTSGYIISGS